MAEMIPEKKKTGSFMNSEIISVLSKFGSYALALAVLVWALHTWNEERVNRAAIEDKYRAEMVGVIKTTLQRSYEDQREDRKLYALVVEYLARSEKREEKMINLLSKVQEGVNFQTKAVTGKLRQLQR